MQFPRDDNRSRPLRGYVRHPGVRERTDPESQLWRERHGVQVSSIAGMKLLAPTISFDEVPFPEFAIEALKSMGYQSELSPRSPQPYHS